MTSIYEAYYAPSMDLVCEVKFNEEHPFTSPIVVTNDTLDGEFARYDEKLGVFLMGEDLTLGYAEVRRG